MQLLLTKIDFLFLFWGLVWLTCIDDIQIKIPFLLGLQTLANPTKEVPSIHLVFNPIPALGVFLLLPFITLSLFPAALYSLQVKFPASTGFENSLLRSCYGIRCNFTLNSRTCTQQIEIVCSSQRLSQQYSSSEIYRNTNYKLIEIWYM